MSARHNEKRLHPSLVRIHTPCLTLDDITLERIDKAAKKFGQTRSRIVQAAIRYKVSVLRGHVKGIRWAFTCFNDFDVPPPTIEAPTPHYITPSLFEEVMENWQHEDE